MTRSNELLPAVVRLVPTPSWMRCCALHHAQKHVLFYRPERGENHTARTAFGGLVQWVGQKVGVLKSAKKDLVILDDISGMLSPGRLTLLLGPPNAGKDKSRAGHGKALHCCAWRV
jgi:hypothetical protein